MHVSNLHSLSSVPSLVPQHSTSSPAATVINSQPRLSHVAIVGLGYVGLPLSLQFGRSGVNVLGLDIDPVKVNALNEGRSYIKHIASETVIELKKAGRFFASTDFSRVKHVGAVLICVPTLKRRGASTSSCLISFQSTVTGRDLDRVAE